MLSFRHFVTGSVLAVLLLAGVTTALPSAVDAQNNGSRQSVHAIAESWNTNRIAMAAVKEDGRLYVRYGRTVFGGGEVVDWAGYQKLGSGDDWVSVDMAMDAWGSVYLVAVKESGALYTRFARSGAGATDTTLRWQSWKKHGANTWSTTSAASIDTNVQGNSSRIYGQVVFSGIKTDGRLYTREAIIDVNDTTTLGATWGGYDRHGLDGWSGADVALDDPNASVWLVGVKEDGRLYSRFKSRQTNSWESFVKQGRSDWDPLAPPAIDASHNSDVIFGAVKADGRLYTRFGRLGEWDGFVRHGVDNWAAVDVWTAGRGHAVVGVKHDGSLFSRERGHPFLQAPWSPWVRHGASNWAVVQPSMGASHYSGFDISILAVKQGGALYYRFNPRNDVLDDSNWKDFQKLGNSDWQNG